MSKKFKSVEDVWDSSRVKLSVLVIEAKDVTNGKAKFKLENPVIKIILNRMDKPPKTLAKTKPQKAKTPSLVTFNDLFTFTNLEPSDYISIEFEDKPGLTSKLIGTAQITQVQTIQPYDEPIDGWYSLVGRPGSKWAVKGSVHLRLYYSIETHKKSKTKGKEKMKFLYEHYMDSFKTGDLIAYSGNGVVAAATKLITNSPFSHLGMIFRLPNKWTRKDELYVVEFTNNIDGLADVYSDTRYEWGVNIFRLFDRIHHYHGPSIWWSSLKNPIKKENYIQCLDYLNEVYDIYKKFNAKENAKNFSDFLKRKDRNMFKIRGKVHDHLQEILQEKGLLYNNLVDLGSSDFVATLMRKLNIASVQQGDETITPDTLICLEAYENPRLIRIRERYWNDLMLPKEIRAKMLGDDDTEDMEDPEVDVVKFLIYI